MTCEGDGELVGEDMILRFEIWGLQREDSGEGGRWLGRVG